MLEEIEVPKEPTYFAHVYIVMAVLLVPVSMAMAMPLWVCILLSVVFALVGVMLETRRFNKIAEIRWIFHECLQTATVEQLVVLLKDKSTSPAKRKMITDYLGEHHPDWRQKAGFHDES